MFTMSQLCKFVSVHQVAKLATTDYKTIFFLPSLYFRAGEITTVVGRKTVREEKKEEGNDFPL